MQSSEIYILIFYKKSLEILLILLKLLQLQQFLLLGIIEPIFPRILKGVIDYNKLIALVGVGHNELIPDCFIVGGREDGVDGHTYHILQHTRDHLGQHVPVHLYAWVRVRLY